MYYISEWLNFIINVREIIQNFGYIGADYDVYSTEDIGKINLDRYKLFIFPNAVSLNSIQRKAINDHLKKHGKTIY